MHFALPPRKTSRPQPYHGTRTAQSTSFMPRRSRLRQLALPFAVVVGIILIISLTRRGSSSEYSVPAGSPPVVLVTTIDPRYGEAYEKIIKDNRIDYATRHGYATFFPKTTDYEIGPATTPSSWSKVPAIRHALNLFSHSTWFFYLDHHAIIMRPDLSLESHLLSKSRIEQLMIPDKAVVPPKSVIHTLKTRSANLVELLLTQDNKGLSQHSFLVKRGEWAHFFLDSWFDPLYRSYNFQRAEGHALEHLIQWHGTILTRLALIPQRTINAYTHGQGDEKYQEGDFIAHFHECDVPEKKRSCANEAAALYQQVTSVYPPVNR